MSESKPNPCPFCGGTTEVVTDEQGYYGVSCIHCDYTSERYEQSIYAIAAHNRVFRSVESAAKRELEARAETREKSSQVGNSAAMRRRKR